MIGSQLRKLREQEKLSLRKLAQKSGLSHSFICDIEHGRCNPSIESLRVLARALGVSPENLLGSVVANSNHSAL